MGLVLGDLNHMQARTGEGPGNEAVYDSFSNLQRSQMPTEDQEMTACSDWEERPHGAYDLYKEAAEGNGKGSEQIVRALTHDPRSWRLYTKGRYAMIPGSGSWRQEDHRAES